MLKLEKKEGTGEVIVEFRYDIKGILNRLLGNGFILTSLLLAVVVLRQGRYKGLLLAGIVWLLGLYILNVDKHYRETTIRMIIKDKTLDYEVLRKTGVILKYIIHVKQIKDVSLKVLKIFSPSKQSGRFRMNRVLYSFDVVTGDGKMHELFPDSNFRGNLEQTITLKKVFEHIIGEVKVLEKDKAVVDGELV